MYLHNNKSLFKSVIKGINETTSYPSAIIEKDYYVSLILKMLSEMNDKVVFKGGTSLSKAYHVIGRFSEDIDITFTEHIGEARRKKLKYNIMKVIADTLGLEISNWDYIQSDRDLNEYLMVYKPSSNLIIQAVQPVIKVETSLSSYSFPVNMMPISSYVYEYLIANDEKDIISKYNLEPFNMKVQSLERTYIDKVFAICDYYINGKSTRLSRHLYDLFKIQGKINFNDEFKALINEVRIHRRKMGSKICPSAQDGVSINAILDNITREDYYKEDFLSVTETLINEEVGYDEVRDNLQKIIEQDYF
ncbi:MAG: nucleotidyl transferase AbiEii/AbiGii toxin family protein [Lachnospiraceae bacterium]|jgi:predicted nucleotidyltransferase component of viral defense system|nr:nucleotidyl transferase AbiEii/AbiGii toxin family protein [Lachnospiraceae bacterium]